MKRWMKRLMQKNILKLFGALQTSKNFRALLFAMEIIGQSHRKACKLNFHWKICGKFFQGSPIQGSKILRPPFCISPP